MKRIILYIFMVSASMQMMSQTNTENSEETVTIKNLDINTAYQDYGLRIVDENTVYFTSSRKTKTIRNKTWKGNNQPFLQLYKGKLNENNEIESVSLFSKKINTKYHDADLTFTKDLSTVYFTRNNYLNKKFKKDSLGRNLNQLYKGTINEKGEWKVVQMPFNNDNYQTGQPALNLNEDKLYFISDMPGGFGATDIYVVDILDNGTYSEPRNLGPNVNTSGKEMFPFIDENDLLYFSSDGYETGLGGLDIYLTRIKNGEVLEKAENLGKPYNSNQDDFAYIKKSKSNSGYFSSNRPGGKGDDDIYYFIDFDPMNFNCQQLVQGTISDENTSEIIPNALVELFNSNGKLMNSVQSDENGTYAFSVDCNSEYKIRASKKDFSTEQTIYKTSKIYDGEHEVNLQLRPSEFISKNGNLVIKHGPILFDLDKYNIRPDAAEILQTVVQVMQKYPEIIIEMGSHTDSRGGDQYNLILSQNRAKSTLNWLLQKGVDQNRISARGYGENQLVNKCSNNVKCSEAEHQLNRRTEFVIVNPEVLSEYLER